LLKTAIGIGLFTGMATRLTSLRNKGMSLLPKSGLGKTLGTGLGAAAGMAPGAIMYNKARKEQDPNIQAAKKKNALSMMGTGGVLGGGLGYSASKSLYKNNPVLNSRKFVGESIPTKQPGFLSKLNPFKSKPKPLTTDPNLTQTAWKVKGPMDKPFSPYGLLPAHKVAGWKAKDIGTLSSKYSRTGALVGAGLGAAPYVKDYLKAKDSKEKNKAIRRGLGFGLGGAVAGGVVGEGYGLVKNPGKWIYEHGKNMAGVR